MNAHSVKEKVVNLSKENPEIRTYSKNTELVAERRKEIMQKAIAIFLKKGYKPTTLREIALACGMSVGNIYRYVGSKDDLLHLLCLARSNSRDGLKNITAENKNANATELLKACIRYHFAVGDQSRLYNMFFNREIYHFSSDDRRVLLDTQKDVIDFFKELLEQGIGSGDFQMRSPTAVAHNILMLGHDWGLRYWYLSRIFTLEEYTNIQTELIMKQISCNSGAIDATTSCAQSVVKKFPKLSSRLDKHRRIKN